MNQEDRRIIYHQDCENARYQDKLRWSRFQTVSAIEGAYLAVIYVAKLDPIRSLFLSVIASVLILVICLIAIKDENDAGVFIERSRLLEKEDEMGAVPLTKAKPVLGFRGRDLMRIAIVLISLINIAVIFDHIIKLCF